MVTGEQVFNLAMVLIDEVTDQGNVSSNDTVYYRGKTPAILTTLQAELLPNNQTPTVITDLSKPLALPDKTCLLVLPNGLAAHLLLTEDAGVASFFQQRYEEMRRKIKTNITPIEDTIGVLDGMM